MTWTDHNGRVRVTTVDASGTYMPRERQLIDQARAEVIADLLATSRTINEELIAVCMIGWLASHAATQEALAQR